MTTCAECNSEAEGICVKCNKPWCKLHGTRTGQGTPVCWICLKMERSKETIFCLTAIAALAQVIPGVIFFAGYHSWGGLILIITGAVTFGVSSILNFSRKSIKQLK